MVNSNTLCGFVCLYHHHHIACPAHSAILMSVVAVKTKDSLLFESWPPSKEWQTNRCGWQWDDIGWHHCLRLFWSLWHFFKRFAWTFSLLIFHLPPTNSLDLGIDMFSVRSYSFVQFGPFPPVKEIFIRYHVNCCICSFNIFNSVLRAERNFTASIPQLFHYFTKVRCPKRQGFQDVREAYGHRPGTRRSSFGEGAAAANGAELRSGSGGTLVQLLATGNSILLATANTTCH